MTYPIDTIYIYNGASRLEAPVTDSAERSHSLQQHNYVKLVWKSAKNTPISANAYIEFDNNVFYCIEEYYPTFKDGIYEYEVEFHAIEDTFNRPIFFRHVEVNDRGNITTWKEAEWSLNGNILTIGNILINSLNQCGYNAEFVLYPSDTYKDTQLKTYSFSGTSISDALAMIAEENETEWWLENTGLRNVNNMPIYYLHFDKCEFGDTKVLSDNFTQDANGVWQSGGLKSVSQSSNTNTIPQTIYVYGSERNILKKTIEEQTEGGVMNVSYDKRLRLPKGAELYENKELGLALLFSGADSSVGIYFVDENGMSVINNNKFEQVKMFDEIYPKMTMTVTEVSVLNPASESPIYYLNADKLKSLVVDSPYDDSLNPGKNGLLLEGCTLMCTFTSGLLNGMEFECAWKESTAQIGLVPKDENDIQIPMGAFVPKAGDTFILWNLAMPTSAVIEAQQELKQEAIKYIEELATTITDTDCVSDAEAFRIGGLNEYMRVGQRISVESDVFRLGRLSSRIIKYSYKLTTPYDVNFTLASSRQTGRLAALENMIADTTHEVHSVGQTQRAISRRQWHDTEEMMSMLDSIQKQLVVVGDENNAFTSSCNVVLTSEKIKVTEGYIQHQSYTENEWKGAWLVTSEFEYAFTQNDANTPFYLYFKANKSDNSAVCGIGNALPQETDNYYVFNFGIVSSEFEGERVFNQSSGLTSIAGGTITTDVVQDPARRLIIDYANAIIRARQGAQIIGKITFVDDEENEQSLSDSLGSLLEGMELAQSEAEQAKTDASQAKEDAKQAQEKASDAYNRDNTNIMLKTKELGFSPDSGAYHYKTMELTEKLKPNTKYVFSVEKSEVTAGSATEFEFTIIKSDYTTKKVTKYIPISSEKKEVAFVTPSTILGSDVVIIYAGRGGATANVGLKLTKFKLEQGSVATAWTPNSQDIENDVDSAKTTAENAKGAIDNLQIGGVNILPFNALTVWVAATYTKARPKYILTTNSNNQCGLYFSESYIKLNTEYVLSFKMKKLSGSVTRVGGYLGEGDISEVWIDGVKVDGKWKDSVPITNDTNEHYIVVKFTQTAKTTGQKIYVQPNRNNWSACQVEMYEFQLEQGNRATSYKENESDKILASENILKDSFRLNMSSDVNTQWRFTKMNLTTNLKPNTEYVLSCFKSSAQSSNSSYPTATKFSVRFMDSGHTYTRLVVNLDISSELQVAKFTTPSNVTSTDAILVYGGHIMDENQNVTTNGTKAQNVTIYGLMLAEGNEYSPWKSATPEEEESLYVMKDALAGSTEISGGLVMTNLIELKNQSGEVTAGISGLSSNKSFTENGASGTFDSSLRFWAGASLGGSSNAPFRVYDNGDVHAGSFYGFNGAFIINNNNIGDLVTISIDELGLMCFSINYRLTGSYIYIDNIDDFIAEKEDEYGTGFNGFLMPTEIFYIGATLEILNPYKYFVASDCSEMPLKKQCNLSNFSKSDTLTNIGSVKSAILDSNSKYFRWSVIPDVCSVMTDTYFKFQAIAAIVPSGKTYVKALNKWKVSGSATVSTSGSFLTTSECLFMRWIIVERSNEV